jgi:hypothetical protein
MRKYMIARKWKLTVKGEQENMQNREHGGRGNGRQAGQDVHTGA